MCLFERGGVCSMTNKNIIEGKWFYASLPYYDTSYDGIESIRLMQKELRQRKILVAKEKESPKMVKHTSERIIKEAKIVEGKGFYASVPYFYEWEETESIRLMQELRQKGNGYTPKRNSTPKTAKATPSKTI